METAQEPRRTMPRRTSHPVRPRTLLALASLLDGDGRWAGGDATLVQAGDVTDRGDDVRAAMELLMRLEAEAAEAGGRVVVLLGNHEVMNMMRDVRYVTPAIYATFADARSESRYAEACANYRAWAEASGRPVEDEAAWSASHPPGYFAYQEAFGPDGHYGRWLREKPVIACLGGTIFLHGGSIPAWRRRRSTRRTGWPGRSWPPLTASGPA